LESHNHNYNSDLDTVIIQVKEEIKSIFFKRKDLIRKLGEAFKHTVSAESICEEIKNASHEEIAQGLISIRDIERYCPIGWKKKTRPKKEENDSLSFSRQMQEVIPLIIDTDGNSVTEQAAISTSESNNNDALKNEGPAKEEAKYTEKFHAGNELEDVIRKSANVDQQLLSEQGKIKELETENERLKLDLQSKSDEIFLLHSQIEDLESKLKADVHDDQENQFFDVGFHLPFEPLCDHMRAYFSKNNHIKSISFIAKADIVTKSITNIQIRREDGEFEPMN
jgi:hypothetical protein